MNKPKQMRMNQQRESTLVNLMGIKYKHCVDHYIYTYSGMWSDWDYFGRLWRWAMGEKWWGHFKNEVIGEEGDGTLGPLFWAVKEEYVDPEAFVEALYKFLKDSGRIT